MGDLEDLVMKGSIVKPTIKPMLGTVKYLSTLKREQKELEKESEEELEVEDMKPLTQIKGMTQLGMVKNGLGGYIMGCIVVLMLALLMYRNF